MNARAFSFVLVALAFLPFVAAEVQYVSLENCGLDTTAYACSATITASCDVYNSWNNTVITQVQFTINDYTISGSLVAGTNQNGTWQMITTNDQRFSDEPVTLSRVSARTSNAFPCSGSTDRDFEGCRVRFSNNVSAQNTCLCQQVRSSGPITIDNTRTVTITPSEGCVDQTVTTYVEFADYCDPSWTGQQSVCAPTASTSDDPFLGTTTKTYTAGNPSCCALTSSAAGYKWYNHNTGSDCTPPIDHNTESTCSIQPALTGQIDVEGTAQAQTTKAVSSFSTRTAGLDTNPWQALSYDFDGDGGQEIVTIQPGSGVSYVQLYSNTMTLLDFDDGGLTPINATTGQPSLAGVTKYSNGTYVFENTTKLLVPATSSVGSPRSKVYVYDVGANDLDLDEVIDLETNSGSTGVLCVEEQCFFADLGATGTAYRYYLDGTGTFAFPPVNGLFLLNGTYQGPLVDGVLLSNMRVQNLKPVFVREQSAGQDEYVVYFSKLDVNVSGTINQRGYAMVTIGGDVIGTHTLSEGTGSGSSTLTLRPAITLGRYVYVPYEELFGGSDLRMGVYVIHLEDDQLDYISNPGRSSIKTIYWEGTRSTSDEGISNAAANGGNGLVQIFARTPSDSLAEVAELTQPTFQIAGESNTNQVDLTTQISFQGVAAHSDGEHSVLAYAVAAPTFPTCQFRAHSLLSGGTTISSGLGGVSCFGNSVFSRSFAYDPASDIMCMFVGSANARILCGSFADPTGFVQTDSELVTGLFSAAGTIYASYALDGYSAIARSTTDNIKLVDITSSSVSQTAILLSGYNISTSPDSSLTGYSSFVAYDQDTDTYLNEFVAITNYQEIIAASASVTPTGYGYRDVPTSLVNYTVASLPNRMGSAAFNWDWNNPKYIGENGIKYTITSFAPFATTATVQSCNGAAISGTNRTGNFIPLYYNSEDHILGMITPAFPNAGSGVYGTLTSRATMGYCDFSDDSAPVLHTYGVELSGRTSFSAGATVVISNHPVPAIYDRDGDGDGSNLELVLHTTTRDGETLSCIDAGASWSCTVIENSEDMCGTVGPGETLNECTVIMAFDETRTAPSNATGSSTETITFDVAGTKVSSYFAPFVKRSMIGVADATGDGNKDVINSYGVFDFTRFTTTNYFSNSNAGQSVAPLDHNGDGAVDVLITGSGVGTTLFTATSSANAVLSGPLQVLNFRCTQVPGTQNVAFQVAAAADSPSTMVVAIDPGDGRGYITQAPTRADGTYIMPFSRAGEYTPSVRVYQQSNPFITDTATCDLVVTQQTQLEATDCTIGSDGEFEFTDPITMHNWKITSSPTGAPRNALSPFSGDLNMLNRFAAEYELSKCGYETVSVEAKLIPTNDNNVFELKGEGSQTAAMIVFRGSQGPSGIVDEAGNLIHQFTWDSSFSTYMTLQITVDRVNGQVYYYVNGDQVYSKTKTFVPTAVKIADGGLFEYVRSSASGNKIGTIVVNPDLEPLSGDEMFLSFCDVDAMQESTDIEVRKSYPNVGSYCQSSDREDAEGVCDLVELSIVASRYPDCSKEVYNYCVYETMKYESGNNGGGVAGATACSGLLIGSNTVGNVIAPTGKTIWSLVTSNLTWVIVVVIFVVFFLIAGALGKRK